MKEERKIENKYEDECDIKFKSKAHEYCELLLMVMMVMWGLVTMVYTVMTIADG